MRPTYDAMMGNAKCRIEIELQFKNNGNMTSLMIKNLIQSSKTLQSNQLNLNNSMAAGIDCIKDCWHHGLSANQQF